MSISWHRHREEFGTIGLLAIRTPLASSIDLPKDESRGSNKMILFNFTKALERNWSECTAIRVAKRA